MLMHMMIDRDGLKVRPRKETQRREGKLEDKILRGDYFNLGLSSCLRRIQ